MHHSTLHRTSNLCPHRIQFDECNGQKNEDGQPCPQLRHDSSRKDEPPSESSLQTNVAAKHAAVNVKLIKIADFMLFGSRQISTGRLTMSIVRLMTRFRDPKALLAVDLGHVLDSSLPDRPEQTTVEN